jgi:serine/threonine-protein kinase RsbW
MHWYGEDIKAEGRSSRLGLAEKLRHATIHRQEEMAPVFEHLEYWMRSLGYMHRDIFALRLILREAVSNALRHGNCNDPAKQVRVTYIVTPDEAIAEVQDEGAGFNPDTVPDQIVGRNRGQSGGMGIFLMRLYSTWVCFNKAGNRVVLCRRRTVTR